MWALSPLKGRTRSRGRRAFVEGVLPWLTSLAFHAGILGLGILTYHSVKVLIQRQVQTAPAETPLYVSEVRASLDPALSGDPNDTRPRLVQDQNDDPAAAGASWDRGSDHASLRSIQPASADTASDTIIGLALNRATGHAGSRNGLDDGSGTLAPFGIAQPGGGGGSAIFRPPFSAHSLAYLCDASGSMLPKFNALKVELNKSIQSLRPSQSFAVHFFSDTKARSFGSPLAVATPENKLRAMNFMEDVVPRGSTDPLPALELAFKAKPDLIFLLTDGDFPDNAAVLNRIRQLNRDKRTKVNTIAFVGESDTDTAFLALLKQIAQENGGVFRYVKQSSAVD